MKKLLVKNPAVYSDGEMTRSVCLICGERLGEYTYRGKNVCADCIKFIRANC